MKYLFSAIAGCLLVSSLISPVAYGSEKPIQKDVRKGTDIGAALGGCGAGAAVGYLGGAVIGTLMLSPAGWIAVPIAGAGCLITGYSGYRLSDYLNKKVETIVNKGFQVAMVNSDVQAKQLPASSSGSDSQSGSKPDSRAAGRAGN